MTHQSITTTYASVENMLFKLCHRFKTSVGLPFEDLMSEAKLVFFRAVETYDATKGAVFSTYLQWVVTNHFLSLIEHAKRAKRKAPPTVSLDQTNGHDQSLSQVLVDQFEDRTSLWEDLSDDAAIIIELVLDAPKDLARSLTPAKGEKAVKNHLRRLGWSWLRIGEAVQEVKEALTY